MLNRDELQTLQSSLKTGIRTGQLDDLRQALVRCEKLLTETSDK